ncbi:hypothetical protein GF323_04205 [Candidatus Woesearchaeota archaeon]|nr:hypothetical protein [Candidatus Woesearchaeota archaeon]
MVDKELLFPYDKLRDEQKQLIEDTRKAIDEGKNFLVHAPTGLGKTIGVLGPALKHAIENNKTVFFLTSRHTQHLLAIKTLRDIDRNFSIGINCCDLIAKKWMCSQPGAENMPSAEFNEYCKALREDKLCEFFENSRKKGKLSSKAEAALEQIKAKMPADTEIINTICRNEKLCPYETAMFLAKKANVIIADYNYMFNARIRDNFLLKSGKKIKESIIIVDEGHNLPQRCRNMLSEKLSTYAITMAIKEAKKFGYHEEIEKLSFLLEVMKDLASGLEEKEEEYVLKREFVKKIDDVMNYDEVQDRFMIIGDEIREQQRRSFIGSIARFMDMWKGPDKAYGRTINIKETKYGIVLTLNYRCLDPSIISKEVVNESKATIMMSGTLTPTEMYADLLGFKNYVMKEYRDIFSERNRLNLIVEDVTTKYTARNNEQYKKTAEILAEITNAVPGNSFVFFPSYQLRNYVHRHFESQSRKRIFLELRGMSTEEKNKFLAGFKGNKKRGGVMLGVAQGSFGEGVDLPGDLLECVIIVGVPLQKPDLETRDLIAYYDEKFGEGMNYGYIYPAITKAMQNAGRCIRSEKDRGVVVFMDARYAWDSYRKCFPADWNMQITKRWKERVGEFFKSSNSE